MDGRKFFGTELRWYRLAAKVTQQELADTTTYSISMINKVELGIRTPPEDLAVKADAAFGLAGVLTRLARAARRDTSKFVDFLGCEARATRMRIYDHRVVTGLLQTPGYATALLELNPDLDAGAVAAQRLERQRVLAQDDLPAVRVVLDEAVLWRVVGDVETMRGQLARLLDAGPAVTVQVIPLESGAQLGIDGAFMILDCVGEPSVVQAEGWAGGILVDEPGDVLRAVRAFDALTARALPVDMSAQFIAAVIEELEEPWVAGGGRAATAEPARVRA